jgi:hypothetical protein
VRYSEIGAHKVLRANSLFNCDGVISEATAQNLKKYQCGSSCRPCHSQRHYAETAIQEAIKHFEIKAPEQQKRSIAQRSD